jgi:hypothetical protein
MDRTFSHRLALAGLIGFSSMLLMTASSLAADSTVQSAQIDSFISDIRAHMQMCSQVSADQADLVVKCTNEKAALVQQQHDLGLTDAQVNARLSGGVQTRGWRWP